ncbi:hypothetical protein ACFLW6_04045 [Chloroflexota bacterium]
MQPSTSTFRPLQTFNRFNPFTSMQPQPTQVSGAYPSAYYPTQSTQTNSFDFSSILQMFMPVMMMAIIVGMVGGMMRGERKEESANQVEGPAVA